MGYGVCVKMKYESLHVFASHLLAKQSYKDEIPSSLRFSERLNLRLVEIGD